jgi:phospholipid/cholesterol/gamma-HCH transport system permease protein
VYVNAHTGWYVAFTVNPFMPTASPTPAAIAQPNPGQLVLSGSWTASSISAVQPQLAALHIPNASPQAASGVVADASGIDALNTAGAWVLHKLLARLESEGHTVSLQGLRPDLSKLMDTVVQHVAAQAKLPKPVEAPQPGILHRTGQVLVDALEQALALLAFLGESAVALVACIAHPGRMRWRPILFNIRSAGFDALPIVGLLAFLLGIVVAYQGADQLRQYGANIFVADLVGLSMLREFAPLITAIIVAGRSGSAYAAQIGTMAVTEEIDAMRTIGIAPMDLLVVPKIIALVIAMPLLTAFADVLGVLGGMIMARTQLDVSFNEFLDRFVKAVSPTAYLIGICKAPVFAAIITLVGCFQGFRTKGGADSVGRQTTRSVVQSIFLVIVANALFSVAFSALDL